MNDYPSWIVSPTSELCVAQGCRQKDAAGPRVAAPGTDLCHWHHASFARTLGDLAHMWPDLEHALYRKKAGGKPNSRVHTSGVSDLSQSWNPHVTEVMAQIADWAGFLVRVVLSERPLPPTQVLDTDSGRTWLERAHGIRTDMSTHLQLATLARHHARWLSGYPFLGPHLLADAYALRMDAIRAIDSDPVFRVGVKEAVCGEVIDQVTNTITTICAATMVAILRADGRPSVIVCSAHPKTHRQYTLTEFMGLYA